LFVAQQFDGGTTIARILIRNDATRIILGVFLLFGTTSPDASREKMNNWNDRDCGPAYIFNWPRGIVDNSNNNNNNNNNNIARHRPAAGHRKVAHWSTKIFILPGNENGPASVERGLGDFWRDGRVAAPKHYFLPLPGDWPAPLSYCLKTMAAVVGTNSRCRRCDHLIDTNNVTAAGHDHVYSGWEVEDCVAYEDMQRAVPVGWNGICLFFTSKTETYEIGQHDFFYFWLVDESVAIF
jgi:hypothetical protein